MSLNGRVVLCETVTGSIRFLQVLGLAAYEDGANSGAVILQTPQQRKLMYQGTENSCVRNNRDTTIGAPDSTFGPD